MSHWPFAVVEDQDGERHVIDFDELLDMCKVLGKQFSEAPKEQILATVVRALMGKLH
jgi:hypothetical protein